jgi:hypothetical protein
MTKSTGRRNGLAVAVLASVGAAALAFACSDGASTDLTSSALSSAVVAETSASGTLICAPAQAQLDACSGKASGDSCSLSSTDGGTDVAGTCRTTLDGKSVACAPNPPAPPQALVDACSGKAKGDPCQAAEKDGDDDDGIVRRACGLARDGTTLVCMRVRNPPQPAIDACTGLAVNDACTLPGRGDGGVIAGTCGLGPTGLSPLACVPTRVRGDAIAACSGLAGGAACTLRSHHESASGTCVVPADGGSQVCVVACSSLHGRFDCGPGRGDDHDHGGPGRH